MKNSGKYLELSSSIKIYIPDSANGQLSSCDFWTHLALLMLTDLFGGATASKALGSWQKKSGERVEEIVNIVLCYCTDQDLKKNIQQIYKFCESLKEDLAQEHIALEINNKLYLI